MLIGFMFALNLIFLVIAKMLFKNHHNKLYLGHFLAWVGMCLYFFVYNPYGLESSIESKRASYPPMSIKNEQLSDNFKKKSKPNYNPSGVYSYQGEYDGVKFVFKYTFVDESTIIKDLIIGDGHHLSGQAKYKFDGSALVFSEVKGDKYLFSLMGEPIEIPSDDLIIIHQVEENMYLSRGSGNT